MILKPFMQPGQQKYVVEINRADKWQVYMRLQELDIPTWCETNQALTVEVTNATAAIQLWSVVRQLTAKRQDLVLALEQCWQYQI